MVAAKTRPGESAKVRSRRSRPRRDTPVLRTPRRARPLPSAASPRSRWSQRPPHRQRRAITSPANRRSRCRSTTARPAAPTTRTSRASMRTPPRTALPSTSTCPPAHRSTAPRPQASRASIPPSTTTPMTSSCRAPTSDVDDYVLTQAQIDYIGDQLVEPDRRRRRGALRPDGCGRPDRARERLARDGRLQRAGRELLRLRRDDLHGRLLRARLHRVVGHERRSSSTPSTGPTASARRLASGTTTTRQRPADPLRGRDRARAGAPAAQLQRSGRAVVGRRGPRGLRGVPQRLRRRRLAPDLPPGVLRRHLAHQVGRRAAELRRRPTRSSSTSGSRPAATATAPTRPTSSTTTPAATC